MRRLPRSGFVFTGALQKLYKAIQEFAPSLELGATDPEVETSYKVHSANPESQALPHSVDLVQVNS